MTIEPRSADATRIEVRVGLDAAEELWRLLESDAPVSPYQRFDWVQAFVAEVTPEADIRLAVLRDGAGRPLLALPLVIERRAGLRVAESLGGKHANFALPIALPSSERLSGPGELLRAMRQIATAIDADVVAMPRMPATWGGVSNPLAQLGLPSPSNAYEVRLDADPEETARRSMSNEARKRLRNKERGLAKLGPVSLVQARDGTEVDNLLSAFFRQKEERFREQGIPDPFGSDRVRAFIRAASSARLDEGCPALELYGLMVGDHVAAVLGGAASRERLSGMFISFASCTDVTKYSPGDILVSRVVREQCLRGRAFFDLGVGEARYKTTFCNETVELVDIFLPTSRRGAVYAAALRAAAGVKRRAKQNPQLMLMMSRLRRYVAAAG